ncbi:MAG: 30S ribosomal protein S16 [Sphingobacteriales bacterium]|nr:30S ribosomal protein S16 [Sphingobacteriales bacterium]
MPVKLRLQRHGRKRKPFYHIVAADARSPRDGAFIERVGYYNPNTQPATIELDVDAALRWLQNGAQPTDTVQAILSYTGVLYKKHLQRGVSKGALTQEQADANFSKFIADKVQKSKPYPNAQR